MICGRAHRQPKAREEFVMALVYPVGSLATHPPRLSPTYKSTVKRSPTKPLIPMRHTLSELTGTVYGHETVREHHHDLTIQGKRESLGERIIVHGHVLDEDGRGVANTLVELWQANACGRYVHVVDQHPTPLDPNFTGAGRTQTDAQGYYRFVTIKPGAYLWGNHHNAWRPAHIHFSVFRSFVRVASGDADVFPRRSLVSVRSDLQFGDG
jgi:protocatechuate 3,4-dioxygenase beta subunit